MKKGLFYAILASVLWAIVNPFIKQGLSYDFSPMNFAGIRFTTVGIILFAYTWHKGMWKEIRQHSKLFLNLILINMFMGYTAFYFGVDFVSGAISSIIMGMTPLINVLLAHLLASNDRLNVHKIISLIVSLIGLLLIVGMGSNGAPLDWKGITGIVLLLLSIIFQGYSAISVSEDKGKINPIFLNAVQMFFGGLLIYGVGIAAEGFHPFWAKPVGFYASLGVLVFISVFAFSFWFMALRTEGTKVSDINMCRLINPVLGAVLSWIMLPGEYPDFSTVAGMAVIVSSLGGDDRATVAAAPALTQNGPSPERNGPFSLRLQRLYLPAAFAVQCFPIRRPAGPCRGAVFPAGLRHPFQNALDGVRRTPCFELGIGAHAVAKDRLVVFDAHDLHLVGRVVLDLQDGAARLVGQYGADPVGHAFEIAVPGRAAGHVDHVDLPEPFVGVGIPRMPFETLVLRVEQVSVLDAADAGIFGQPGHGGEAVGHAER